MPTARPTFAFSCRAAVLLTIVSPLSACGEPAPELPADSAEAAATCYAAKVIKAPGGTLTADQANEAAQFLFLGAIKDGLASPTVLAQLSAKGHALQAEVAKAGDAARYDEPCSKRFPQTAAGTFKELPADGRDTRMMCFTLSSAILQTYQSSRIVPSPATVAMNAKLDSGLMAEINAQGPVNPAEIAGFAMRSMAKATELGPMSEVLKACADRYKG